MTDTRPGLNPRRLARLVGEAVQRCRLDLRGLTVLTEAASGAYVVTPVLAALAGAERVWALTRDTRFGTVDEIAFRTLHLAKMVGVRERIEIVADKCEALVSGADIVTNSGHVRPIDARMVGWMKPTAVVPLMYEAWEYRTADLDLQACRDRGIPVAGTNERHPAVDVFAFLGVMAVKLLLDAGVAVYGSHLLLLCDNPFGPYIERGLRGAGAQVDSDAVLPDGPASYDAIVVALQPRSEPVVDAAAARDIAERWQGAVVVQYWGDLDRAACRRAGLPLWPAEAPPSGHMGILPSGVGPEPIVRLQAGGLKVGEILARGPHTVDPSARELVQLL